MTKAKRWRVTSEKSPSPEQIKRHKPVVPPYSALRDSCSKLRGLAYLLELCGDHPAPPFDEREAFYGVSLIAGDIHREVLDYARAVERWEIHREQRRASRLAVNQSRENVNLG